MQLRLTRIGRLFMGALAVCVLVPGWASANTAAVLHMPTGHVYVVSGTDTPRELIKQAQVACQDKEGIVGDAKKANQCIPMQNFPPGACDSTYGKGNQFVTVGGYQWKKVQGFSGFYDCAKTQQQSDQIFQKHCAAPGCTIWQHYNDNYNTQ